MDRITFLITLFCLIDDWLKDRRVRQRGPAPALHDSEVLTIEIAGAFFGIDTDAGITLHFRRCYAALFPRLLQVDRTTFVRQSANLWKVKEALWQHLLTQIDYDPALSLIDSCPIPVCRFARVPHSRRLREYSAYGKDEAAQQVYYGMRLHARLCWPGVIVGFALAPADAGDLPVATDALLPGVDGWVLADRNYANAWQQTQWPRALVHKRRRIETVFSQLVQRYQVKRVWAHDLWHLASRWLRCILSHTCAMLLCQQTGLPPLQFDRLLTD
jgi:Transposase DDE domain